MKKLACGIAMLAMSAATPALAATGDQTATWDVTGSVTAACGAITGSLLDFDTLNVDATGHLSDTRTIASASQPAWCNGITSTLTYSHAALSNSKTVTDTANYTNVIDFTPIIEIGASPVASGATVHEFADGLVVKASALAPTGGKRPLAGDYAGTITVTLTPGV
jgi:hypothetical protein